MARRMLIDATHSEETRVVVISGSKLDEFDFETSTKKQIKGNIYLAKITRVEPSLQAAFVEYGGNRHGFLSFSEIHPDYYRIPVSDREALVAEERADAEASYQREEAGHDGDAEFADDASPAREDAEQDDSDGEAEPSSGETDAPGERYAELAVSESRDDRVEALFSSESTDEASVQDAPSEEAVQSDASGPGDEASQGDEPAEAATPVDTLGGDDLYDIEPAPRARHHRSYKIQEVIKRRQILLVQVTKEERGTKGAALTTYLSLAGRYCVLMPNAGRGGGVSRKITSLADRRRLRELMDELDVPEGMGVIVRTAGSEQSQTEIKRDYEYLMRLWDDIRELTLRSSAPALIYEEGNLIKRAIRDLYTRDINEILVEGHKGFQTAREFMEMLSPGHADRVREYRDPAIPLLHRFQVDAQIDQIHNPVVQLKSGGYIVINPTEALVSIDVNSGRATRERNIEETATKTNVEAAEEIARQLRLRDLAGLVVIDFIDMEETRNQKLVEHRMRDAMKSDRARIQVGRISAFGLLELSRQRLRSSLIEASTQPCPHCNGTGNIRSTEATSLVVLRALEEEGIRRRTAEISVFVPTNVALYLLNQKREALTHLESRYACRVTVGNDDSLIPPAYRLERMRPMTPEEIEALPSAQGEDVESYDEISTPPDRVGDARRSEDPAQPREETDGSDRAAGETGEGGSRRRRRRRRRRPDGGTDATAGSSEQDDSGETGPESETELEPAADDSQSPVSADTPAGLAGSDGDPRKRRRGRRGGRRRRRDEGGPAPEAAIEPEFEAGFPSPFDFARDGRIEAFDDEPPVDLVEPQPEATEQPMAEAIASVPELAETLAEPVVTKRRRAPRRKSADAEPAMDASETPAAVEVTEPVSADPEMKPKARRTRKPKAVAEPVPEVAPAEPETPPLPASVVDEAPMVEEPASPEEAVVSLPEPAPEETSPAEPDQPRKTGWWRRLVS